MSKAKTTGTAGKTTKLDELATYLRHKGGRTTEAICAEFGWIPKSTRAAITKICKPKSKGGLGVKVKSTRTDTASCYEVRS